MSDLISIIIPCRNEEKFIAQCLDSVLAQDYPQDRMEVLIAEGMSTDKTRDILDKYTKKYPYISFFDNPKKNIPAALNLLVRKAKGDILVRLDAHNEYPSNYVSGCVKALIEHNADNVGGLWITRPGSNTLEARAIAISTSSKFGVGSVSYKQGVKEDIQVDTVPFGCFRRDVFDRFGLFDEDLLRGEDCELNHRIIKGGGKIFLIPGVVSYYYARNTFGKMAQMYAQYGYFKAFTAVKLSGVFTVRQLIPAIFVGSILLLAGFGFYYPVFWWLLLGDLGTYALSNILFSIKLALKEDVKLFPFLIWAFCLIHAFFGFNYLRGIFDFWILKKHLRRKITDVAITR